MNGMRENVMDLISVDLEKLLPWEGSAVKVISDM